MVSGQVIARKIHDQSASQRIQAVAQQAEIAIVAQRSPDAVTGNRIWRSVDVAYRPTRQGRFVSVRCTREGESAVARRWTSLPNAHEPQKIEMLGNAF